MKTFFIFQVVDNIGVSKEWLSYAIVKEALDKCGVTFNKYNTTHKELFIRVVEEQEWVNSKLKLFIFALEKLDEEKSKDVGG